MKCYPSWRYHKTLEPKVIHSEAEEHEEWVDTPAFFEEKAEEPKVEASSAAAAKPRAVKKTQAAE